MKYAAWALIGAWMLVACRPGEPGAPSRFPAQTSQTLERHAYAWQEAALESWAGKPVTGTTPELNLWWFAGQVDMAPSGPKVEAFPTPPPRDGARIAGLVYRLRTPVINWLQTTGDEAMRIALTAPLARVVEAAGLSPVRVQLDFDCPTAKLKEYARLLGQFRSALPAAELSITALPDWLGSPDFGLLLKHVDFYVLQVHGLSLPATVNDSAPIFDARRAARYIDEAAAFGVPFHVALPTYGHRQWFRPEGTFVGISAEIPGNLSASGHIVREERADPAEVAACVRALESQHPASLHGLFWFRLPAEGDELNWCLDTFRLVLAGIDPPQSLSVELREAEPGLVTVHLHNGSNRDYRGRAEVSLGLPAGVRVLGEGQRGFALEQQGTEVVLSGRGPDPGASMEIGWIRSAGQEALNTNLINLQVRSLQ